MSAQAARRLLFFAFALSLFIHIIFVLLVPKAVRNHESVVVERNKPIPVTISRVQPTPRMTPPQPPRSTPTAMVSRHSTSILKHTMPTPPSRLAHVHREMARAHLPAKTAQTNVQTGAGTLPMQGPGSHASTPVPRLCNAPAAIAVAPEVPEIAPEARAQMTAGIARITVHLDARGGVLDASVTNSTGNTSLDQVAVSMAKNATYLPARTSCKPVVGEYVFSARFAAW